MNLGTDWLGWEYWPAFLANFKLHRLMGVAVAGPTGLLL
jgi:hypothetical protein